MFLPDINVWLALAFEAHFHHLAAKAWFNALPDDASAFLPPSDCADPWVAPSKL
jgi:predicted nucleic acid-binding protein